MSVRRLLGTALAMAVAGAALAVLSPGTEALLGAVRHPQALADAAGPDVVVLSWAALLAWLTFRSVVREDAALWLPTLMSALVFVGTALAGQRLATRFVFSAATELRPTLEQLSDAGADAAYPSMAEWLAAI